MLSSVDVLLPFTCHVLVEKLYFGEEGEMRAKITVSAKIITTGDKNAKEIVEYINGHRVININEDADPKLADREDLAFF